MHLFLRPRAHSTSSHFHLCRSCWDQCPIETDPHHLLDCCLLAEKLVAEACRQGGSRTTKKDVARDEWRDAGSSHRQAPAVALKRMTSGENVAQAARAASSETLIVSGSKVFPAPYHRASSKTQQRALCSGMIIGIGNDLLQVSRMAALVAGKGSQRVSSRILSSQEIPHFHKIPETEREQRVRFLGVRSVASSGLVHEFDTEKRICKDGRPRRQSTRPYFLE